MDQNKPMSEQIAEEIWNEMSLWAEFAVLCDPKLNLSAEEDRKIFLKFAAAAVRRVFFTQVMHGVAVREGEEPLT